MVVSYILVESFHFLLLSILSGTVSHITCFVNDAGPEILPEPLKPSAKMSPSSSPAMKFSAEEAALLPNMFVHAQLGRSR